MAKINVENWFMLEESNKLEDQVKGFIAYTVEGYLNGVQFGYEPMTRQEWKEYIIEDLRRDMACGMIVNGIERKHMKFIGNKKRDKLIDTFLDNYEGVQDYIKEEEE